MKLFIVNLLAGTNWTHHLPSGVYVDIYIELHATFGLKLKPFQDTTIKIHGFTPTAQSVADLCTLQLEFGKSCIRCLRENYGRKLFCTVSKPLLKYERRSKFNFTTIVFLKFTYCSRLNGIRIGVIFVSLYFCSRDTIITGEIVLVILLYVEDTTSSYERFAFASNVLIVTSIFVHLSNFGSSPFSLHTTRNVSTDGIRFCDATPLNFNH